MNRCGLNTNEQFKNDLISSLKNITGDIETSFMEALRTLRASYKEDDFVDSVKEILTSNNILVRKLRRNNANLNTYLDNSLEDLTLDMLETKVDSSVIDVIKEDSKTDKMDENSGEQKLREAMEEAFLVSYFPFSSDARLAFKQRFKNQIVQNLFINKSTNAHTLNSNRKGVDASIKSYIEELKSSVDKFSEQVLSSSNLQIYKNLGNRWQDKLEYLQQNIDQGFISIPRNELIKIPYIDSMDKNSSLRNKLEGYLAFVTLSNFDDLIQNSFGKAVTISYKGDTFNTNEKYALNLGDSNAQGWSDDTQDKDQTEEIGSIIQLYVESLDMYDVNGNLLPYKMTFSGVKSGLSTIMEVLEKVHDINFMMNEATIDYEIEQAFQNSNLYGNSWNYIKQNYITGHSLQEFIALAKNDPTMYAPVLFGILASSSMQGIYKNRYQNRQQVISLFKNIYDPSNINSLLNIVSRSNLTSAFPGIYEFFNTLFVNIERTPFIEYKRDTDGSLKIINITQNNTDRRLRNQIAAWNGMYNAKEAQKFNTFVLSAIKDKELVVVVRESNTSLNIKSTTNGIEVRLDGFQEEILPTLSEIFGFEINDDFLRIYYGLGQEFNDLLKIAGNILYNYKVGKELNAKTVKEYDDNIGKYYEGETSPQSNRNICPDLIPKKIYTIIQEFSRAKDILQGFVGESTAKDGEGKQISILGLSQLMSKYKELVYNNNFKDISIVKNFNIINLFGGIEFVRDYNGFDSKQQAVKFTESEFFSASFIYDLYDTISELDEKTGNSYEISSSSKNAFSAFLRVFGPIISDKNKLPKIKANWFGDVKFPDGTTKKLKDLTVDDIYAIQNKEFGDYYERMLEEIKYQYGLLVIPEGDVNFLNEAFINILRKRGFTEIPVFDLYINYDQNFIGFNDVINSVCQQLGTSVKPSQVLHDAIALYQQSTFNDSDSIEIVDGVHYIQDENGNLENNPSLFHQLSIYGRAIPNAIVSHYQEEINETPEQARQRRIFQTVSELIRGDVQIVATSNDKAGKLARTKNRQFLQGDHISYGVLSDGTNIKQLNSLNSFAKWKPYRNLIEIFGNNIPNKFNINNPEFELADTLQAINIVGKYLQLKSNKEIRNKLASETKKLPSKKEQARIVEEFLRKENPHWGDEAIQKHTKERLQNPETVAKIYTNYIIQNNIIKALNGDKKALNNLEKLATQENIEYSDYSLTINPEIERHNVLNIWLNESFQITSVGSFIAHPAKSNLPSIHQYENQQVGQQIKRNVSHTAAKHREVQNTLQGIRKTLRLAIIRDEEDSIITYNGFYDKGATTPYDGASFYNMFMMFLDNNSLGADAMGQDKKPFIHALNPKNGIGFIGKMAGFIVTNDHIRQGGGPGIEGRDAKMNRLMNDSIKWSQTLKSAKNKYGITYDKEFYDWTKDYNNQDIQLNSQYFFKDGKWFKRENFTVDENGLTNYLETELDITGEPRGEAIPKSEKIDSNWQLWNLFGGAYSAHFDARGYLTYQENDMSSTKAVVEVMNKSGISYGKLAASKIKSQANVYQVLKESQIDIIPIEGATKFGATNVNDIDVWEEENPILTTMEIDSSDVGEQLDAEHEGEGGHVSLMTQVINALGSRGYSRVQAQECYEALEALANESFEEAQNELVKESNGTRNDFKAAITNIIISTLKHIDLEDGNILSAIVQGLKNVSSENVEGFAISDPRIFANVLSKLSSQLERSAVRLKFDGGQYVLNPSNRRFTFIGNKPSSQVTQEELLQLQQQAFENPITNPSQIEFGRSYYIIENGIRWQVDVDNYYDYLRVQNALSTPVYEAFISGLDQNNLPTSLSKPITRDLASYNCIVYDYEGNPYSIWQTDIVRQLHTINKNGTFTQSKNGVIVPLGSFELAWNKYKNKELLTSEEEQIIDNYLLKLKVPFDENLKPRRDIELKNYLSLHLQKTLDAVSEGIGNEIVINENAIKIDKTKTQIQSYEAILPMMYKEQFGLEAGDEVQTIENDPYFFLRRALRNAESKIRQDYFHLELKSLNGKHIYLTYSDGSQVKTLGSTELVHGRDWFTDMEGEHMFRIDSEGKKMYEIPYYKNENGKLIPAINIRKHRNGAEVISTQDITMFLDQFNYQDIEISSQADDQTKIMLRQLMQDSTNETAQEVSKINNFKRVPYSRKIQTILDQITTKPEITPKELLDITQDPDIQQLIKKAITQHTSFLTSLEAIVSRTPAQSQQSFMAMKIAGFDQNTTNSIYVSRFQLYAQGSDFDIDKANVLGLKFINGQLIIWSPYYDLNTRETAKESEKLPFPTGKRIEYGLSDKTAFDVMDKDYTVQILNEGTQIVVTDSFNHSVQFIKGENGVWNWVNAENITTPTHYMILMAALNKISDGERINIPDAPALGINNGIKDSTTLDRVQNLAIFLQTIDTNTIQGKNTLIRLFNKLGSVPEEFNGFTKIVDKHNLFLKKKYKRAALYNFISIKSKNISKSPINLIQGQIGIDEATKSYKKLVSPDGKFNKLSANAKSFDASTVMAKIKSLCLTLSGKQNVGIVASAMKTFEAMSHYYYTILAEGSEEEQKDLLFDIKIDGKQFSLIANSYVANEDNIKSDDVLKALRNINNLEDAFIAFSVFVSLSTDNAKDPTLSKYNAGPEMIGCYTAGIVLGLNIEEMANLIISDTGLILSKMQKGNVFNGQKSKFNRLGQAIEYLTNPPLFLWNRFADKTNPIEKPLIDSFNNLLKSFGIPTNNKGEYDTFALRNALKSSYFRRKMRAIAMALLSKKEGKEKSDFTILKQLISDIQNDRNYWNWKKNKESLFNELIQKENKTEEEEKKLSYLLKDKEQFDNLEKRLNYLNNILSQYYSLQTEEERNSLLTGVKEINDERKLENDTDISLLKGSQYLKTWAQDILDWSDLYSQIENDRTENGFTRLYEIKKLNNVNEEMGELRKVLALNQGLPNLIQDQIAWIGSFRTILSQAAKRKGISSEDISKIPELKVLSDLNDELRKQGKIYFEDKLGIDLNSFLNNHTYQQAVINAYSVCKQAVNIMKAMITVPHYKGYLNTMNLLYEGSKAVSVVYKEQCKIYDKILPKLKLRSEKMEAFKKGVTPIIFRKINNDFLQQEQKQYSIPKFIVQNGELIEDLNEDGTLKYEVIKLGTKSGNQKFKNWVEYYLFPALQKSHPDNAFIKGITLRSYNFTLDHNPTRNLAKIQQFNMKDPKENVMFNEMKQGLSELNYDGILTALFYYNLIAYNGQPGAQSLTDLFEDEVIYDKNEHIANYSKFLSMLDKSEKSIFNLESDEETLIQLLAPVVTQYDNISGYPYMYILDPETNKYKLVKPKIKESTKELSDEEQDVLDQIIPDISEEYDDNEVSGIEFEYEVGRRKSYQTWSALKNTKQLIEIHPNFSSIYETKEYVLGNSQLLNPEKVESILKENKNILESDYKDINLKINREIKTLEEIFNEAQKLGWNKDECKQILKTKETITGNGLVYKTLDLDILRYGLNTILKQKPNQEDCG